MLGIITVTHGLLLVCTPPFLSPAASNVELEAY